MDDDEEAVNNPNGQSSSVLVLLLPLLQCPSAFQTQDRHVESSDLRRWGRAKARGSKVSRQTQHCILFIFFFPPEEEDDRSPVFFFFFAEVKGELQEITDNGLSGEAIGERGELWLMGCMIITAMMIIMQ